MTPSELKYNVESRGETSHFFDRKTMKFFGDTMANFGVRSAERNGVECWELYRKRPVKNRLNTSHFFDKRDFRIVF